MACRIIRIMRRFAQLRFPSRACRSLTLFCDAEQWWEMLHRLQATDEPANHPHRPLEHLVAIEMEVRRAKESKEQREAATDWT